MDLKRDACSELRELASRRIYRSRHLSHEGADLRAASHEALSS
jgi:hypothetical protein